MKVRGECAGNYEKIFTHLRLIHICNFVTPRLPMVLLLIERS